MYLGGIVVSSLIGGFCYRSFSVGGSAAVRYAGTFLQILGLLTVALGLYRMRQLFPSTTRGWFGRLVHAWFADGSCKHSVGPNQATFTSRRGTSSL
jgi:hypothetical protein